jgi:hypothetical protein
MKKIFWIILLVFGYVWVVTTGHQEFILGQGRHLYEIISEWFDDADVDFQVQSKPEITKKKARRWD